MEMEVAKSVKQESRHLSDVRFKVYGDKKEEKHRLYQIERLKIETIILEYQINELAKLMGDDK